MAAENVDFSEFVVVKIREEFRVKSEISCKHRRKMETERGDERKSQGQRQRRETGTETETEKGTETGTEKETENGIETGTRDRRKRQGQRQG